MVSYEPLLGGIKDATCPFAGVTKHMQVHVKLRLMDLSGWHPPRERMGAAA
jgi:hypothetical protein